MKTRDRIAETARRLFNAHGYGNVTTAVIAQECGISEGNLWYHFNSKREILAKIAENFAQDIAVRLRLCPQPDADALDSFAMLLTRIMDEFRHYRFLYRDQASYGEHVEVIAINVGGWIFQTYDQIEIHLKSLVSAGVFDAAGFGLRDIAINATIILRYGLEHFQEIGKASNEGQGAAKETLRRLLTLFEYRLLPVARARLHTAIDRHKVDIPGVAVDAG